jgi:thiamine pyrophosphate-dependent acetolactate synthase large subunit-like protein
LNKSKLAKLTGIPRRDLIQIIQAIKNKIKVDNDGYTYTVNYQVKVKIVGDIDTVISEIEAMDNTININCNNGLIVNISKGKL